MPVSDSLRGEQPDVNQYFHERAAYWKSMYEHEGVVEKVHQERLRATMALVDSLHLEPGARILDMGCGAGFATVSVARRGFCVDARDSVEAMVETTRKRAIEAKLDARVTVGTADINAIPFPDAQFDLVICLGVLPWLADIETPLDELSRVLKPGGHLIVTHDTKWQLRQIFDPFHTPILRRPREFAGRLLGRPWGVRSHTMNPADFRSALSRRRLEEVRGATLGFGPFTLFKREVLPASLGVKLNAWLQSLADAGITPITSLGSQYLALTQKRS